MSETLGADKAYGYGAAAAALVNTGVTVHAPLLKENHHHVHSQGIFGPERFTYDAQADVMICPAGKTMRARTWHKHNQMMEYGASKVDCRQCPFKQQCTRAPSRVVHRYIHQAALDRLAQWRQSPAYAISLRCRKRIEHLFAEAKEQMGLRRARLRGKANVLEQCLMTALAQNLKRMVKALESHSKTFSHGLKTSWLKMTASFMTFTIRIKSFFLHDLTRLHLTPASSN